MSHLIVATIIQFLGLDITCQLIGSGFSNCQSNWVKAKVKCCKSLDHFKQFLTWKPVTRIPSTIITSCHPWPTGERVGCSWQILLSPSQQLFKGFTSLQSCPVSWGCRIYQLHLCREITSPRLSVPDMTLNNLIVRFQQYWCFGECGVPLHCHLFQVHWPGVVAYDRVLSMV